MNRRIDFGKDITWAAHRQDVWLEHAGNPYFPDYMRVVFVAYGRHHANGHARLLPGELAVYLIRRDGTMPDRRNMYRAIGRAVELGFLAVGSKALCLVVSSHQIQGGRGNPDRRCDRDHRVRRRQKDVTTGSHSSEKDVISRGHLRKKDVTTGSHLVLSPSLSLSPSPAPNHQESA